MHDILLEYDMIMYIWRLRMREESKISVKKTIFKFLFLIKSRFLQCKISISPNKNQLKPSRFESIQYK